jgi:hypothetical protein
MSKPNACLLCLGMLCCSAAVQAATAGPTPPVVAPDPAARTDWRWLNDTYWYVPARNLLALTFDAGSETLSPTTDQTVWHITGYAGHYFWGRVVAALRNGPATNTYCQSLVGSVTPEGRVLLTFVPTSPGNNAEVIRASGDMRMVAGRWTVEPQMSSGPSAQLQVSHWAYMTQCLPGDAVCQSLPGLGQSIDSLLAACPGAPTLAP